MKVDLIDLHTHTTASDGLLKPQQLVKEAEKKGLSAIAVTDHDQVSGISRAKKAAQVLEIVPGVELTTYLKSSKGQDKKEFHILGYFIDYQSKRLKAGLEKFNQEREKRAGKIILKLEKLGFKINKDYLAEIAQGAVGRPHISQAVLNNRQNKALLKEKFTLIPNIGQFIRSFIIPGKPAYVEKFALSPKKAISLIHQVGGLAILAHPCWDVAVGDEGIIRRFKSWGIDGLEAIAPAKNIDQTKKHIAYFSKIADKHGLLITGGSDYHGFKENGAGLGLLNWGLQIPGEILKDLKKKLR